MRKAFAAWLDNLCIKPEDPDIYCDCGNPNCDAHLQLRKGYVHIRHGDGSKETRWDYLYLNPIDSVTPEDPSVAATCDECEGMQENFCDEARKGKKKCESFVLGKAGWGRRTRFLELMLPPECARDLMWFFILLYMPGVSQAVSRWDHLIFRIQAKLEDA